MARQDVKERHGTKDISLPTGCRWMPELRMQWRKHNKGMYKDGHERADVQLHLHAKYLPKWYAYEPRMRHWDFETGEESVPYGPWPRDYEAPPRPRPVVAWFHDESTFAQHDRRQSQWVHEDASPLPLPKGEGASTMVADFVSADYGWLRGKSEGDATRLLLKVGKNRDGYFQNENVLEHVHKAMDILKRDYPEEDHLFIFDNAPTHTKRAPGELSALKMPKGIPKAGTNWGVEVPMRDDEGGIVHAANGKPRKTKIRMRDAKFADGTAQPLYFPEGHPRAGIFKGMAVILEERGFAFAHDLRAQCGKNFKCLNLLAGTQGVPACCCRRLLYNQPDFAGVRSLLENECEARGFDTLFLPKFHPELNPIEQCWGRAKLKYRVNPPTPTEAEVEGNVIAALDSVTLSLIRKYCVRSQRFTDAYHKGLSTEIAVWAGKKYHGHRVVPNTVLNMFDEAHGIVAATKK
ncbi:hypothetical protein EXIGLDRAFT_686149 [Exidia glandulosa HHB12029]|uniref:Tc1-like transposase DDE domain-containing protein n=1 Tax=Exidia glandulosa HHB12029 TaxID=1314781 RepID=A0A165BVB0_EXIGL|nr:hypothetical protein EXIGLDRAFT_686149 [Exidia glandulosa HHB12029]